MIRALYDLTVWAAQSLLRRKLRRRGRAEPGYLHALEERFGHYTQPRPESDTAQGRPLIWIHAVSLGETRAAAILLTELRARLPDMRLLLTHGTATGRAEGGKLLRAGDVQVWQPWDTRAATRRFFAHFRPDAGVLIETEIWPNLIDEGHRAGVPIALANARLSVKSLRGARRAAVWLRPAYAALSAVWAQTEADAERLRLAGVRDVAVLGNLKFDAVPDAVAVARGQAWRARATRPVVMLASSQPGEEQALLVAIRALPQPDRVQWLIVPRHPQRFDEVAGLIRAAGWPVSRRCAWPEEGPPAGAENGIWLGDSLGEMACYYTLADAALLGGSFAPMGGQNLIEAAACGCPVVMGPHTYNFHEAARLACQAGAALRMDDMAQAVDAATTLLEDRPRQAAARQAARAFAASQHGAAARMTGALQALLLAGMDKRQR
ncbi:MAG: 3-deoxy-D-manno-octulosonic acid transferase [Burkholderiaceae bacterium]|jgi:3-deoxy-D-manno-octulosonic-acid transferase|nr:3-deoxy-D-manno-octulosonic acid transferase [Burkholderiaceae bacterium]